MRELTIKKNQAGQRLDKFLAKYLKEAPKSFFYKMMRKKNIVLNGKKAAGSEMLVEGDSVKLFLSEETIEKFMGKEPSKRASLPALDLDVVYEDEHIVLINKPFGLLSQKAEPGDVSLVEYLIEYLLGTGAVTREELATFHPGICNRLDRNTSGLVVAGKSLEGLQVMNRCFKERTIHKYYLCLVKGRMEEGQHIKGYLKKDTSTNRVTITDSQVEGSLPIETAYKPLAGNPKTTLVEVALITGRSHQIRAHLASMGYPIIGDGKYGAPKVNQHFRKNYGLNHQLLHSWWLKMPELQGDFAHLSEKPFMAKPPELFLRIMKEEGLDYGNLEF